jgi:hypothetical protein
MKGENCRDVANTYDVDEAELKWMNQEYLDCDTAVIGERLCVATFKEELESVKAVAKRLTRSIPKDERVLYANQAEKDVEETISSHGRCDLNYLVSANDTCASIYQKHNSSLTEFMDLNHETCCGTLKLNQKVCIFGIPPSEDVKQMMIELQDDRNSTAFCTYDNRNATMQSKETFVQLKPDFQDEKKGGRGDRDVGDEGRVEPDDAVQDILASVPKSGESNSPADWLRFHNQCRVQSGRSSVSWDAYLTAYKLFIFNHLVVPRITPRYWLTETAGSYIRMSMVRISGPDLLGSFISRVAVSILGALSRWATD